MVGEPKLHRPEYDQRIVFSPRDFDPEAIPIVTYGREVYIEIGTKPDLSLGAGSQNENTFCVGVTINGVPSYACRQLIFHVCPPSPPSWQVLGGAPLLKDKVQNRYLFRFLNEDGSYFFLGIQVDSNTVWINCYFPEFDDRRMQ